MPTPVDVARQCLAESAAAVLEDAVAVAKRRNHAQTTSLHIVSSLLALPSSILREACSRIRNSACSVRLQFRALELSVSVALDRVSVSKTAGDEPPVSNSLMAAIKRSQANQRRHPETFHLYQQQPNSDSLTSPSISVVKVEMGHFVISVLDDPIVSRVFGDGGFRIQDVKMAITNPLTMCRFSPTTYRPPLLFHGALSNLEPPMRAPFSQKAPSTEGLDENSRRIADILLNISERNPLLVGAHARDAHRVFIKCLKKRVCGILPKEIDGLSVVSTGHDISACSEAAKSLEEEIVRSKFKQVDQMVKDCQDPGIIVDCGDLKVFVDGGSANIINYMLSELKRLVISHGRRLWLIGYLAGEVDYKKLVERFPSFEMDLDLHYLPITATCNAENTFKCSLPRSFVPLGGFFSMPSENEGLSTSGLCNLCNEKYQREVSDVLKGVSISSLAARESRSLPSWLQIAESEPRKKSFTAETKEDKSVLDFQVLASKRKWSDICRRLHSSSTPREDISRAMPSYVSTTPFFRSFHTRSSVAGVGSLPIISHSRSKLSKPIVPTKHTNEDPPEGPCVTSSTPLPLITTNLRLSEIHEPIEEHTRKLDEAPSWPHHAKNMHSKDLNNPWAALADKLHWQASAVQTISRVVSRWRSQDENCPNGSVWLSLLGPDRVGKRKIALGIAEIVFGCKEKLISLDLNVDCLDAITTPLFDSCEWKHHKKVKSGRKVMVDYLAEELSNHPHSVVLLENVDQADYMVWDRLHLAIKMGKFINSCGREIVINNVFLLASTALKPAEGPFSNKPEPDFPEEKILEAQNLQMQILVGSRDSICRRNNAMSVSVITPSTISSKRKSSDHYLTRGEVGKRTCRLSRSFIDLNQPVEDIEEDGEMLTGDDENDENDKSDARLGELLEHVDESVAFEPFDFDSLSREIIEDINARLKKAVGCTVMLGIDVEVMYQILGAAWVADEANALGDWIENVLCSGLEEARRRCGVSGGVVMKLVHCSGCVVEARTASGLCLPALINLD